MSERDDLDPRARAADILLGGLGYGEEAQIVSVQRLTVGYKGKGRWPDGSDFEFESEDPLTELEDWALSQLLATDKQKSAK
jgi:hypothetical protein